VAAADLEDQTILDQAAADLQEMRQVHHRAIQDMQDTYISLGKF
jgi:hypothetical protein